MAMSNIDEIDKSIKRLKKLDWEKGHDFEKQDSYKLLIREWLRRMTLWGKSLNATNKWPFINVVDKIFGEGNIKDYSDPLIVEMSSFLSAKGIGARAISVCIWYILWSEVKDRSEISQFNLPEPYEPVIVYFELGGWLRKEQNFLDFVMIDIDNWKEYDLLEPFIILDEEIKL